MYERYYSTCQEMCRGLGTVRECQESDWVKEKKEEHKSKGSEPKGDTEKGE